MMAAYLPLPGRFAHPDLILSGFSLSAASGCRFLPESSSSRMRPNCSRSLFSCSIRRCSASARSLIIRAFPLPAFAWLRPGPSVPDDRVRSALPTCRAPCQAFRPVWSVFRSSSATRAYRTFPCRGSSCSTRYGRVVVRLSVREKRYPPAGDPDGGGSRCIPAGMFWVWCNKQPACCTFFRPGNDRQRGCFPFCMPGGTLRITFRQI